MPLKELREKKFIIPIYQRNYAWTDVEIHQLIDDIDHFHKEKKYHIGSLVLFDKGKGVYEVTDGQQRLTTLALILLWLKEKDKDIMAQDRLTINLNFEAREESNGILKELRDNYESAITKEDNELVYALKSYIEPKLMALEDIEQFKNKLLSSVILNENILPEGTDMHHYFERMNSRGKQLELHAVLRAKLLEGQDETTFQ